MEKSEAQKPEQRKSKHKAQPKETQEKAEGNSPGAPAAPDLQTQTSPEKIALSQEEIAQLRKKANEYDELLDQCKRIKAEFANYQKRMEKEKEQWSSRAKKEFLLQILPVIDDLYRTRKACSLVQDADSIREGLEILCGSAEKILNNLSVKAVKSVGEKFDPTLHEAVLTQETEEFPEGTVISEIEPGYTVGDGILLRPSKVIVSVKPEPQKSPEEPVQTARDAERTNDSEAEKEL